MKRIIFAGMLPKTSDKSRNKIKKTSTPEFFDFQSMRSEPVEILWQKIECISRSTGIAGNYEYKKYTNSNGIVFTQRETINI